jgi:hypothetical protein
MPSISLASCLIYTMHVYLKNENGWGITTTPIFSCKWLLIFQFPLCFGFLHYTQHYSTDRTLFNASTGGAVGSLSLPGLCALGFPYGCPAPLASGFCGCLTFERVQGSMHVRDESDEMWSCTFQLLRLPTSYATTDKLTFRGVRTAGTRFCHCSTYCDRG